MADNPVASDHVERYHAVAAGFEARLASVGPDRWDVPTPCEHWTVRALVLHSAGVHQRIAAMAGVELPAPDEADPAGSWRSASAAVLTVLDDPDRRTAVVASRAGDVPFEQLVGTLLSADTLIHTWDLARGAGLDENLDARSVAAVLAFMMPNDELLRVPGGFGPALEPPAGADEQVRLLCFAGRAAG